jgi:hypothetical protein
MSRLLPLLGFLLLAALFGFGIYWSRVHDPREVPSPLIGKPAPAFSLPRLDDPAQAAQLTANGLAPTNPKESGIFASLPPGMFTAVLAGKNGSVGIGLVEIYDLQ